MVRTPIRKSLSFGFLDDAEYAYSRCDLSPVKNGETARFKRNDPLSALLDDRSNRSPYDAQPILFSTVFRRARHVANREVLG